MSAYPLDIFSIKIFDEVALMQAEETFDGSLFEFISGNFIFCAKCTTGKEICSV